MKIWNKLFNSNQEGMLSLHAIIPIVLAIAAIGGVGAYVLSKSGASSTTQGQLTTQTGAYTLSTGWSSVLKLNSDPADAADELVFYNGTSGQVSGYQNSTATSLTGKIYDVKANAGWAVVLGANIDGDKDDELVYYNKTTGALAFYGATATSTGTKLATNTVTVPGYDLVVAMDVDGNNANDELMFYNKTTGATKLYKVTAAGLVATPYGSFTLSAGWDAITGADFNGDGNDEAVFYRRSDGLLKVYDNVGAAGVSGEMANFVTDKTWTAIVGANLKNTTKDNLYFYNSATGAVKTYDGINFAYVPAVTPPATGTTPPPPPVYTGKFACTVDPLNAAKVYTFKVTNNTNKNTESLSEINMVGTNAAGTKVTLNGTKDAAQFAWTGGFSSSKMLIGKQVTFTVKSNNIAQDKWKLSISGVEYGCAAVAASGSGGGATVDTKPYTTLPGAPSVESMTYASWKAWSDGVTTHKALTGQALVDKLKPLKEAYDAKVAFAATITCKGVFPGTIVLGTLSAPKPNTVTLDITNKGKYAVPANTFTVSLVDKRSDVTAGKTVGAVGVPLVAVNATVSKVSPSVSFVKTNGTKVTLSLKLLNAEGKIVANCDNSYKTYDLGTGAQTATPDKDKPAAVVLVGKTPVAATPPANTSTTAVQKVSDLHYKPELICVFKKDGKLLADKTCANATGLLMVVGVEKGYTEGKPTRKQLSYDIDIIKTNDKSNVAKKCAERKVVIGKTEKTLGCTVLFTDQSVFTATRNAVVNRFKAILRIAQNDNNLTAAEARLRIQQLRNQDTLTKGVNMTMAYKGYMSQQIKNYKIVFDYDENTYVNQINDILEQQATEAAAAAQQASNDGTGSGTPSPQPQPQPQPEPQPLTTAQKCANANGEMVGDNCYKFSCPKRGPLNGVIVPGSRSPGDQSLGRTCQYSAVFLPTFYGKPNYTRVTL